MAVIYLKVDVLPMGINMKFIKGVDVSMLYELEELGGKYYDEGVEEDIFFIFKKYGVNAVRLRIWDNPYDEDGNPYGGGTNDYEKTVKMAKRAVDAGMEFVLDIHYSDFWTDPKKQLRPKAWMDYDKVELENKVYEYTHDLIMRLKKQDLKPSMIQIGNEITEGLLWPFGKLPDYAGMSRLLKKGIDAVRDIDENIQIILHLDLGGDNELYRNWFDKAVEHLLDFDIIGLSYYPYWHGTMEELVINMNDISKRYNKEVMVVETAYGFTTDHLNGSAMIFSEQLAQNVIYEPNPSGQMEFLRDLMTQIKQVHNEKGRGFFYWEPDWIPVTGSTWATKEGRAYIGDKAKGGNSWANQALFDFNGNALPALKMMKEFI